MTAIDPAETFRQEAQDLLEQLEQTLLDLEHAPDSTDLIDSAFRALHTIKGSGAMFGFDKVAAFTHHVETAFDLVRKGKASPSRELIALALSARDHMRELIDDPEGESNSTGEAILAALKTLIESPDLQVVVETPASAPNRSEWNTWRIRIQLPRDVMVTGTNPLLLLADLCSLGEANVVTNIGEVPALADIIPTDCYIGWEVVLSTLEPKSSIEQVFLFVFDDMDLKIEKLDDSAQERRLGEILVDRGDAEVSDVEAALAQQEPIGKILVQSGKVSDEKVTAALSEQKHLRDGGRTGKAGDAIRVPAERLDDLMDRVGELVIAQSRLKQVATDSADPEVQSISEEIERLALELRDSTMGVRMVPFGSLFGRFRRMVHDLSRELGKGIQLVTSGEETELDKTVIERLNDPLIHLIRNAIDHGLETTEARTEAGKPENGIITLTARHAGAEVLISIADDGRGLDPQRIQAKAVENGLIAPDTNLSDSELFQLIFQPGFSTAKEVTSLSGRGVGMDVVKRTIDGLRGTIDVASRPGEGTQVTLRLPLTLAIIDGLLVRVGDGRYVIPLSAVEECVELSPDEDARSQTRSFLSIRGELVPFLRLRDLFNSGVPADRYQKVVIVSSGELRVGLVVDQVIGDHQTVIKSLSKLHADVETFSGATILGDGSVALILEIPHLVEYGQTREEQLKATG